MDRLDDYKAFQARDLSMTDFVYMWADGVHPKVRLDQTKASVLVMVGVRADGSKELIALDEGCRESGESWANLLRDWTGRGMRAPHLADVSNAGSGWGGHSGRGRRLPRRVPNGRARGRPRHRLAHGSPVRARSARMENGPRMQVVQEGHRLAYRHDREHVQIFTPEGKAGHFDVRFRSGPDGMLFWHDGTDLLMSLRHPGGWRTFVHQGLDSDGTLLARLDERRSIGPSAASDAEVLFPGAERPTKVDCFDGRLRVHNAEGGIASSFGFGATQEPSWGERAILPPGWFPHQCPVDSTGSAALRRVDRATADRLVEAGLQGADAVARRMGELIPEISDERLKRSVADAAAIAGQCLLARLTISGLDRRAEADRPADRPGTGGRPAGHPQLRDARQLADPDRPPPEGGRTTEQGRALPTRHGQAAELLPPNRVPLRRPRRPCASPSSEDHWSSPSSPAARLLRTLTGAAVVLLRTSVDELSMIEYSPDGRFTPMDFPTWRLHGLLKANGPLPIRPALRPALAWDLATKTGISPQDAARVCFTDARIAAAIDDPQRYPPEVVAAYETAAADKWQISNLRTGAEDSAPGPIRAHLTKT